LSAEIIYDDISIRQEQIYNMTGNDYHDFSPPTSLRNIYEQPTDYAMLLQNYIRLDGTKELITEL